MGFQMVVVNRSQLDPLWRRPTKYLQTTRTSDHGSTCNRTTLYTCRKLLKLMTMMMMMKMPFLAFQSKEFQDVNIVLLKNALYYLTISNLRNAKQFLAVPRQLYR